MIPRADIIAWQSVAPWSAIEHVEQDLIISKSLVDIFNNPLLRDTLAFRGGTALHKLYLPALRYSEDIDFVQIKEGQIGPVIDELRRCLSYLGKPKLKQKDRNTTLMFRVDSEIPPVIPLRLKVEINCREHKFVYGFQYAEFAIDTRWAKGQTRITTFTLEELLATKLRALYQRKKGRDLFDLAEGFKQQNVVIKNVWRAFEHYTKHQGNPVTLRQLQLNMEDKLNDSDFIGDVVALLRPNVDFDASQSWDYIWGLLNFS